MPDTIKFLEADGSTTVADSRILNQENQWSYTWENLSTEARWSAVESQVPAGYYVSTARADSTVVVTNTAKQPVSDKNNTQTQSNKPGAELPQTGQLWWPVLVLLLGGIICIVVGCSFSRTKRLTNRSKMDMVMKEKTTKTGRIFIFIGLLLIAAALSLLVYNIWDARRAEQRQSEILAEFQKEAGDESKVLAQEIPDYVLNPEMEMPQVLLEQGNLACIGVLEIPAIDLQLPVLSEWSYPLLQEAPCRYSGSAYMDNLVIAAHNYPTHFGKLKSLQIGDEVSFTDASGNRFEYKVAAVEALSAQSVEDMTSGEWPLSLFTCTLDGKNRVTVRCE